jgi:glutamine amidotransferase
MKNEKVTIIDYGLGNLLSLKRALEFVGAIVDISNNHKAILDSSRVILPGIGAFPTAVEHIKSLKLDEVLLSTANKERPFLGICLGMQLLLSTSEEFSLTKGLNLISGKVVPIQVSLKNKIKIPHIGWNSLVLSKNKKKWENTILKNIKPSAEVYFVHSFKALTSDSNNNIADCIYGTQTISSVVQKKNIIGCQFHPEKSGKIGLQILKNFLEL